MSNLIYGQRYRRLLDKSRAEGYALPAVNVVNTNTVNAALEAAAKVGSDIIIQVSSGGAQFFAGKGVADKFQAQVKGAVAFAKYTREIAALYDVNVILHTDHANKKLLPWIDGLLTAGEEYYAQHGEPLFSSHMIDLSAEPLEENVATCKEFLVRIEKLEMSLEIELGVTGGEEDGVDNEDVDNAKLYTQPEEVLYAYDELKDTGHITVAASFGNVHGVYKPGNVELRPIILHNSQERIQADRGTEAKPLSFVFHGGSGSDRADIREAIGYGVFKMNIDTDTQFAFTKPVRDYCVDNEYRLARQIGTPEDPDAPNKKVLDPRVWMRLAEENFRDRLCLAFEDLLGMGKRVDA